MQVPSIQVLVQRVNHLPQPCCNGVVYRALRMQQGATLVHRVPNRAQGVAD